LRPYLDSELDAKTSLDVEQHLDACAECAELFAAERKFDERVDASLKQGERTPRLWQKVESQIHQGSVTSRLNAPTLQRFSSFKRLWPVALAASVVAVIALLVRQQTNSLDLASAVEECHSAYVHRITSPEFTGAVPDEIARRLGERLDVGAFAFRPAAADFTAQGARFCHVQAVPVALILGRFQDVPVSLIVMKQSELENFPRTQRRLASGDPIVCGKAGRYQFAARLVNGHVVCIVGDRPRPSLEDLLRTVSKPG
jgi:anti-sigma factor RsiW